MEARSIVPSKFHLNHDNIWKVFQISFRFKGSFDGLLDTFGGFRPFSGGHSVFVDRSTRNQINQDIGHSFENESQLSLVFNSEIAGRQAL